MKKLLVLCGVGIASSTIIADNIKKYLDGEGINVMIDKASLLDLRGDDGTKANSYDLIVSATKVPDNVTTKVISGMNILTGLGIDTTFSEIKEVLTHD